MKRLSLLIFMVVFASCNKLSPASFWKNLDNEHIVKSTSDQGPWGGKRTISWKNRAGIYKRGYVVRFAEKNGWKLKYTTVIDTLLDRNISIDNEGLSPEDAELVLYGGNTDANYSFSGCVNNGCTLYEFDSGWTKVIEWEDVMATGYILVNSAGTRMTMFHSWGE